MRKRMTYKDVEQLFDRDPEAYAGILGFDLKMYGGDSVATSRRKPHTKKKRRK
ncbi:hypothetical protein AB6735_18615 [Mucilaginibacter sp. RCC_168]|uniref:hypothetical protein n=1 Tax=Mucilaginibacter sp. RCC_168 TaxID=3239221 RepID=UPI003525ECDB